MANTSNKLKPKSRREIAYYKQRQRNLQQTELAAFFAEEAEQRGITKKDLADVLGKDPAQITRWLSAPTNLETDTITEILLALDAEMERRIVRFSEKPRPNYVHPLIASIFDQTQFASTKSSTPINATTASAHTASVWPPATTVTVIAHAPEGATIIAPKPPSIRVGAAE